MGTLGNDMGGAWEWGADKFAWEMGVSVHLADRIGGMTRKKSMNSAANDCATEIMG